MPPRLAFVSDPAALWTGHGPILLQETEPRGTDVRPRPSWWVTRYAGRCSPGPGQWGHAEEERSVGAQAISLSGPGGKPASAGWSVARAISPQSGNPSTREGSTRRCNKWGLRVEVFEMDGMSDCFQTCPQTQPLFEALDFHGDRTKQTSSEPCPDWKRASTSQHSVRFSLAHQPVPESRPPGRVS